MTTTRMFRILGLSVLGFSLTGCVANEKYQAQKLANASAVEQLAAAQRDAQAAKAEADAYRQQLQMLGANGNSKEAMLVNLQQQNSDLQRQLDELNQRYADAVNKVGTGQVLPEPLNNALQTFASQNPDLVDFDSTKGIVKFKSDVVFNPGSADLAPNAKTAITRFAQILNSPDARGYELMVVGHTDNTRVVNPATIKAGHLDNWFLSAHRAIAVGTDLQRNAISPERLMVAGCAEQRPAASNTTSQGKQQNRRVEVLILPNTIRTGFAKASAPAAAAQPRTAGAAVRRAPELNKDTAITDPRPTLNK